MIRRQNGCIANLDGLYPLDVLVSFPISGKTYVGIYDFSLTEITTFSYISEAAASLLDDRLDLHVVPPTQLVSLSSPVRGPFVVDRVTPILS